MREELLNKLMRLQAQAPYIPPTVLLDEYFMGNTDEGCIAFNQIGNGRPPLKDVYKFFKKIQDKPEVQTVLVGLYFDWEEAIKNPNAWPPAENIHIYTTASLEEATKWTAEVSADFVCEGWLYGKHPASLKPNPGVNIYTVCWD